MSASKIDSNTSSKMIFSYQLGDSISSIAANTNVSRSTVRRHLREKGVYDSREQDYKEMISLLHISGITTPDQLRKFIRGNALDNELATLNPKEWGQLLYSAAVKRHKLVNKFMEKQDTTSDNV